MKESQERSAGINPLQVVWREAARGILRHPLLRTEGSVDDFGGLEKLCEYVGQGKGGIVVEMHFSTSDPLWAIDSITKNQAKSVKITAPIAKHQAFFGLLPFAKSIGVKAIKVVTPESKYRADKKGENDLKRGEGTLQYLDEAAPTVRDGGIVVVASNATRKPKLTLDKDGVVTRLIKGLYDRGVSIEDSWIHFVAFEIPGLENYGDKKVRGLKLFKKYKVIHGETITLNELLNRAKIDIKENETRDKWRQRNLQNIEEAVFSEQAKIAPKEYLGKEL